ncbi:hypothetical protein ASPZODRAFT_19263 [Penicilliopsis zonata CBS 506.65]|uniref:Carboxylesterase type B domain-containing protein n=1 Tax=Penicilliopsis zonata CBS 506.65 TaxID=1073090 RepID=A0A1L9S8Q7_9EURO|nr:hypothetical protein ASPZODRAFT_19263 [Penicilliopsis zonata CBS 506.65]OJJ43540.1 hypothetical protein ASPZODRAFT_19263 [Penicilliopsis zonata CBS 506.65]
MASRTPITIDNKGEGRSVEIGKLRLHGFTSTHGVANFLNVPFATIPARFKTAKLLDPTTLNGDLDASQYGPRCPQPADPIHIIMHNMFEVQSMEQYSSELDCLHVNIYAPADFESGKKLPVFVYIHGGAFNCGDNTTEFDGNHLVKRSIELGRPIVVVTINYRLNVLGFLTSRELIAEAESAGERAVANQGLNDQKLALQWIQRNIHHFGGDGHRVTLSGESCGAASVVCQLKNTEPLFHQVIIQSTPLPRLRTLDEAQQVFDTLVRTAGVSLSAPGPVKLAAVRSLPAATLIDAVDLAGPSFPIEDADFFPGYNTTIDAVEYWSRVPSYCRRVIIGHTKDEGALFFVPPLDGLTSEKLTNIISCLNPDPKFTSALLDSQLFTSATSPMRALVAFGTRSVFQRPVMELAAAMATRDNAQQVYVYGIDATDPFPGPLHGYSWHSFGVPIMFYQPACQKHAELKATADRMSEIYLGFFHGEEPWEGYAVAQRKWTWKGEQSGMVTPEDLTDEALVALQGDQELTEAYLLKRERLLESVLGCVC